MNDKADFFSSRPDQMIELSHPLAVFTSRLPWRALDAAVAHPFDQKFRAGEDTSDADLFGGVAKAVGAGMSPAGRLHLPVLTQSFTAQALLSKGQTCEHPSGCRQGHDGAFASVANQRGHRADAIDGNTIKRVHACSTVNRATGRLKVNSSGTTI